MSQLQKTFSELKQKNQKAFTAFVTAGDPNFETTQKVILALEKGGASIIELGIPFSDPMADGQVIQKSSERALKNGVTLKKILNFVTKVRKHTQIPIVLMGYYNPIYQMGLKAFAKACQKAKVDGVIVVDLPVEESESLQSQLKLCEIDQIHLISPISSKERIQKIQKMGSGFVYYVSFTGITGANRLDPKTIKKRLHEIRKIISHPIQIGFGISKPEHVKSLAPFADGVVVGSEIVKTITKTYGKKGWLKGLEEKVKRLTKPLS